MPVIGTLVTAGAAVSPAQIVGTPVIGTPVTTGVIASPAPVATSPAVCGEQNQLSPQVSRYYKRLVLSRLLSIQITGGQVATITWTVRDRDGHPVDLTTCGLSASSSSSSLSSSDSTDSAAGVELRFTEQLSLASRGGLPYAGTVITPADGKVRFELPAAATKIPGVYFAEVGVLDEDGNLRFANSFYLVIARSQYAKRQRGGPPSMAEIRLHLRDSAPEENFLLDNLKFDDAEIALAIKRPVEYWNEIPPDIARFTTNTFPFRYFWLEAICGNLFLMVAEQFRANHLVYAAAGVTVDDQNKEPNYEKAAQGRLAGWYDFVRRKKSELNLENAYGGIGSPYGW